MDTHDEQKKSSTSRDTSHLLWESWWRTNMFLLVMFCSHLFSSREALKHIETFIYVGIRSRMSSDERISCSTNTYTHTHTVWENQIHHCTFVCHCFSHPLWQHWLRRIDRRRHEVTDNTRVMQHTQTHTVVCVWGVVSRISHICLTEKFVTHLFPHICSPCATRPLQVRSEAMCHWEATVNDIQSRQMLQDFGDTRTTWHDCSSWRWTR